ncbi:MAG TPA: ATP-binding protein, partial [Chloroflexia bacterium]|nr:ATP-binding protein [Chloroflexia bacterium]
VNAERRTWGTWVAAGGLLLGAGFFLSHSAILGRGMTYVGQWMNFWWYVGWGPAVAAPFSWYLVVLWYAGFWDDRQTPLHRRQRVPFAVVTLLAVGLAARLVFIDLLPTYTQLALGDLGSTPTMGGVPVLLVLYPVFIMACLGLSLDALRRPAPSGRMMGELARERARPWLTATSLVLLGVSLLVAAALFWFVGNAHKFPLETLQAGVPPELALLDLACATLIGISILLLGQAVAVYEIFTGKTLPRRGFVQHWQRAVILAAGYSVVVGGSLARELHPIYGLLLATGLMIVFFALQSWRAYAERDRYMGRLRPFVSSPRLYDDLLARTASGLPAVDVRTTFKALCDDLLGTRVAYLAAVGPLSPLVGPPLAHPDADAVPPLALVETAGRFASLQTLILPVDAAAHGGAGWAVPLWSERGLIGLLLLGDKRDGGLYTQEEIEIARATGERLIDTTASAEMAGRLMALQRQRLAESQVLDRRARRVLHDDVLPRLHTAMLVLSGGTGAATPEALDSLATVHRQISDLLRELPAATAPEVTQLGLVGALQQTVRDELGSAFDAVTWDVGPDAAAAAGRIAPLTAEVVFYAAREAIRNAARYGRPAGGAGPLHLHVGLACRDGLEVLIEDDGVGLGAAERKDGGSGQGLALHSTMMAVVGGSLATESVPGRYTRVQLLLPV